MFLRFWRVGVVALALCWGGLSLMPRLSAWFASDVIAYVGGFPQDRDIIVYDIQRGLRINLTPGDPFELWPKWSPDGTQIAYTALRGTGTYRIYVIDLLTREERLLTPPEFDTGGVDPNYLDLLWSADGETIVARRGRDALFAVHVESATVRPMDVDEPLAQTYLERLASTRTTAPDGLQTIEWRVIEETWRLVYRDVDANLWMLPEYRTFPPVTDFNPPIVWSPGSGYVLLVFYAAGGAESHIYRLDVPDGVPRRMIEDGFEPDFRPDSRR